MLTLTDIQVLTKQPIFKVYCKVFEVLINLS